MEAYQSIFKRYEKKYLLTKEQYEGIRQYMDTIAEVDKYGQTTIMNIYYDTPDWRLIRTSLEKPAYKEKLRLRTYGAADGEKEAFLELKKKYDGIVYKRRISLPYRAATGFLAGGYAALEEKDVQIGKEIVWFLRYYKDIAPKMVISYERVAMAGKEDPDFRVTFDTGIRYRTDELDLTAGSFGKAVLPEGTVLMELKIAGAMPLALSRKMAELGIFGTSVSKYGCAYTKAYAEGELAVPWTVPKRAAQDMPAKTVRNAAAGTGRHVPESADTDRRKRHRGRDLWDPEARTAYPVLLGQARRHAG